MATLKQIRDRADIKLAQFWQLLTEKQNAYYQKHGKYFQLLVTGGREVGSSEEYNFTPNLPDDEKYAIDVDFPWTEKIPFQIQVDEWVGEDKGYTAIVTVDWNGRTFTRSRNSKQEDSGWLEIVDEPLEPII